MKRGLARIGLVASVLVALFIGHSLLHAADKTPSVAGTTWRTEEGATWVFKKGGGLTHNVQLVKQVAGEWSQDGRIVTFYDRHVGIEDARLGHIRINPDSWSESRYQGTIDGKRMTVKVNYRVSDGTTAQFQMVLKPISKWPPKPQKRPPPDVPLGPIMEVKVPEEPFFQSAEPLIGEIEAKYEWLKESGFSDTLVTGQPLYRLDERVAGAKREVEDINDKGRKLRANGRALLAEQEDARSRRATEQLRTLRTEITAHNRACDDLLLEAKMTKTVLSDTVLDTLNILSSHVPTGAVGAIQGEVWSTDKYGKKIRLESGEPVYHYGTLETGANGRVQILLEDESIFTVGPDSKMVLDEFVYDPLRAVA
jgi:hypothetical protein